MKHKHTWHFARVEYLYGFDNWLKQNNLEEGLYSFWVCDCGAMKKVKIKEEKNGI